MISIAVVDDEKEQIDFALKCLKEMENAEYKFRVETFTNPVDCLNTIRANGNFDIYLLDIYMPEMTGISIGNEIKKISDDAIIIFTTTSRSHAIEAFELSALSYLVKPFTKDKLIAAITKAVNVYNQNNLKSIVIKTTDGMKKVAIKDIMYVGADKHYQIFYLTDETVVVRSTISSVWDSLKNDMRFIQPHASFIVNMDYIARIDGDDIELTNKERIPISKQMKAKVKNSYLDYMFVR